jgi:ligand-binding SRPBCC domain-containing protein
VDRPYEIVACSILKSPPSEVWRHAITATGINHELMPLARMTFPAAVAALTPETVRLGERVCRSWVLLFGIVPVDYDDVTLIELEPGRRFLERSPMLSQRFWEHERTLMESGGGTRICDRVRFIPRLGPIAPLYARIFRAAFALRHRNLRKIFGGEPA